MQNDNLLRALRLEPVNHTPVWLMRQAGRYLPEYRQTRKRAGSFLNLCHNAELATEVTLQPIQRFDLDAAILFSDILILPDVMGLELHFKEGEGPVFNKPIELITEIDNLKIPEPNADMPFTLDAIKMIKHELAERIPLIGFTGSPWTVATYMIEGKASKDFSKIKGWRYQSPASLHRLLNKVSMATSQYLKAQIQAGADVIMLFDSWGGVLTTPDYHEFSLYYMQQIINDLKQDPLTQQTPTIIFTKGGNLWLEDIANTGCNGIGVDWTITPEAAVNRLQNYSVTLQGNLDPMALLGTPENLRQQVMQLKKGFAGARGHIFNLGHGICKETQPEMVEMLVNLVHQP